MIQIENADMSNDKGSIETSPPKVEGFLCTVRQHRVNRPLRLWAKAQIDGYSMKISKSI